MHACTAWIPNGLPERFDLSYYRGLLEKAWREISYAFLWDGRDICGVWEAQKDLISPG